MRRISEVIQEMVCPNGDPDCENEQCRRLRDKVLTVIADAVAREYNEHVIAESIREGLLRTP